MLTLLLLLLLQVPTQGEKKADSKPPVQIALSTLEQQQLNQAAQVVQSRDAEFKRSLNAVAECPLEPDKTLEVVAKVQTAIARSQAAQAEFDRLVATFQAHHSCPDCRLTPDGKALTMPNEEKQK
jgi:hypothetical protein